jgi:hypothetical protein
MTDLALTTSPALDAQQVLQRFERGEEMVDIAAAFYCSPHKLGIALEGKYDADRIAAAEVANAEAAIEAALNAVRNCIDKDQAVELNAAKIVLETRKWQAERRTKRYRPPQVKASVGSSVTPLTINIVGMNGATLRTALTIEHGES